MPSDVDSPLHQPTGFAAIRTPRLPFEEWRRWGAELEGPAAPAPEDLEDLAVRLERDRARLRDRLLERARRREFREALFLASPSLVASIDALRPGDGPPENLTRSLVSYFIRMIGRPSPFGLFAGCSVALVGDETQLTLEASSADRRHTRLDMEYLFALAHALETHPAIRPHLRYSPNPSLYALGDRLRYAESRFQGGSRQNRLVSVEASPPLLQTLSRARGGCTPGELAAGLASEEITREEASAFVDELIDEQLLVSDLQPSVTGGEPIREMSTRLSRLGVSRADEVARSLEETHAELRRLDAPGPTDPIHSYRSLAAKLETLGAPVDEARLFQVDLAKSSPRATFARDLVEETSRAILVLHQLLVWDRDGPLDRFRAAFRERFGDREVALPRALDEELGIGFDGSADPATGTAELLETLPLGRAARRGPEWTARDTFLHARLEELRDRDSTELVLDPTDVDRLAEPGRPALPDALAAFGVALRPESATGARVSILSVTGPSGARLLGRFCHLPTDLRRWVETHLRDEERQRPDAVFAEVVHVPQGRVGNVIFRPALRPYDIPYLGRSGLDLEHQIHLDDLLVRIDRDQVRIRSRRLDREIVPRLTNAHNYYWKGLPAYRFLCALQDQGAASSLAWDWGPLACYRFLPRVRSGRAVLARARWTLSRAEIVETGRGTVAERFRTLERLRETRRIPRFVLLSEGDLESPLDLQNVLAIEFLLERISGWPDAVLLEMLPGPDELVAEAPEGRFVHEFVLPLVRPPATGGSGARPQGSMVLPDGTQGEDRRSFPPGSEWLQANLFTGFATADRILREAALPLARELEASGIVDRWFFIRYGSPSWHLRLRFHGEPGRLLGDVYPALLERTRPYRETGEAWRLQIDTYEREVERYGGWEAIEIAERIAHADSVAVSTLLGMGAPDENRLQRWRLALLGIDRLLGDLGFDLASRAAIAGDAYASYAAEYGLTEAHRRHLGTRFRPERPLLESILLERVDRTSLFAEATAAFARRSELIRQARAELGAIERQGRLSVPVPELAVAYLHMHCNRLLNSAQRQQEMVLCEYLSRIYRSFLARESSRGRGRP